MSVLFFYYICKIKFNIMENDNKVLCPSCNRVMSDHGEFGKICGMCWIWSYEIKK